MQELYELAQRKLLRELTNYNDSSGNILYPRLIIVDFLDDSELDRPATVISVPDTSGSYKDENVLKELQVVEECKDAVPDGSKVIRKPKNSIPHSPEKVGSESNDDKRLTAGARKISTASLTSDRLASDTKVSYDSGKQHQFRRKIKTKHETTNEHISVEPSYLKKLKNAEMKDNNEKLSGSVDKNKKDTSLTERQDDPPIGRKKGKKVQKVSADSVHTDSDGLAQQEGVIHKRSPKEEIAVDAPNTTKKKKGKKEIDLAETGQRKLAGDKLKSIKKNKTSKKGKDIGEDSENMTAITELRESKQSFAGSDTSKKIQSQKFKNKTDEGVKTSTTSRPMTSVKTAYVSTAGSMRSRNFCFKLLCEHEQVIIVL